MRWQICDHYCPPYTWQPDSFNCGERNSNYVLHYLCYISCRLPHTHSYVVFKSVCHFPHRFWTRAVPLPTLPPNTHLCFFSSWSPGIWNNGKMAGCPVWSNEDTGTATLPFLCLFQSLTAHWCTNWKNYREPGPNYHNCHGCYAVKAPM